MGKVLIVVLLLGVLVVYFQRIADWFLDRKNINIIPAALIDTVAVLVFLGTYGSTDAGEILWMWLSVAVVIGITGFNLIKHGFKAGALASLAELIFSVAAAFLLICVFAASGSKKKGRKKK